MTEYPDVPIQVVSQEIYEKKYRLMDYHGKPVDLSIKDTYQRVAMALASVENDPVKWEKEFYWALDNGAIPAGRIISNAGAEEFKPSTSTINCTVSGRIDDSMESILDRLKEAGLTLKAGCGIGYNFSSLRPKGALVSGVGAATSGPLSFMDVFDALCATVSSAGGRRGAQMATFLIRHPDVLDYVKAKRQDGRLRHFNMSVLVTEDFLQALRNDQDWEFMFPVRYDEHELYPDAEYKYMYWYEDLGNKNDYIYNIEEGLTEQVLCKIYGRVKATEIWDVIAQSTYDYAEPGVIFMDEINKQNNLWWEETIMATNPCGEQPLPPWGACLLGSINLTKFVIDPFLPTATFDYEKFEKVVSIFTRMLDNVVEINGLPLENQRKEIVRKRRHGMGFTGLGSALTMLCIPYGSKEAIDFTEHVSYRLAVTGWHTGVELAKEKGPAPIMTEGFVLTSELLRKQPLLKNEYSEGMMIIGKVLFAEYSEYMLRLYDAMGEAGPILKQDLITHGCRFTHHSSIAPTGTISLALANNASNGIEPSFSHKYFRNLTVEGKKTRQQVPVYSYELLLYGHLVDSGVLNEEYGGFIPNYFVSSDAVTPTQHVDMQAAAQKWIDSSISKTINCPTDMKFDVFKNIYGYAAEKGLKGCTTFRFNPTAMTGVLTRKEDLDSTLYKFYLADGTEVELKGSDKVEYEGEIHNVAMLYDSIKEGRYDRGY
jgi:ribonucleoside-diphosphate reductase alpha chain